MLERHIIPVLDCDLVVYHRPGNANKKGHIIFYHGLVAVVRCGPSMMPLRDLTSILSMLEAG